MSDSSSFALLVKSLPLLLSSAVTTLEIAAIAMFFGMIGGILLGVLNCRKCSAPYLSGLISGFVWTMRGTPLFVQVLIVYYALPEALGFSLSPFTAGVIALGVNSSAYISEIVRGGIDALPDGQWEAAQVLGLTRMQTVRGIILPQMFRAVLPSLTNELTSLIKETSILMVIGVAELTKTSKDIVARELDPMTIFLAAAVIYLAMTSVLSIVAQKMQKQVQS